MLGARIGPYEIGAELTRGLASSYCMPVERRVELLGVSTAQAERELARCLERVARGVR